MLYILYGSDMQRASAQASKLVAGLRARRPEVSVYTFDTPTVPVSEIDALVGASGLFVEKHIVVLRSLFEQKEMADALAQRAERFAGSQNVFIIVDGRLLAEHTRALLPHAHKVEEYHVPKKERVFDAFGLVAALKRRNRRALWEAYVRATRSGETPEAVCGLLHWAVRDMCTSSSRYAHLYSLAELRGHSRALLTLYHEAHCGRYDMAVALEHWTLTV